LTSSTVNRSTARISWSGSVLDDDHRLSLDQTFEPRRPERGVGEPDGEQRERGDGQHRPRHGSVFSGDSLLDQVPHHDQQDQLERRQFRELLAADRAADDPHEEEQGDGTHQDLHHGTTLGRVRDAHDGLAVDDQRCRRSGELVEPWFRVPIHRNPEVVAGRRIEDVDRLGVCAGRRRGIRLEVRDVEQMQVIERGRQADRLIEAILMR
jgi:hypothetical protein